MAYKLQPGAIIDIEDQFDLIATYAPGYVWRNYMTLPNPNQTQLVEPVKIVIQQEAFTALPVEKKKILFDLKKQTASQETSDDRMSILWYFSPPVFLDVVKKHPWLLDKNLGEKEPEDFFGYGVGGRIP